MSSTTKLEGFVWPAGLPAEFRWAARDAKVVNSSGKWALFDVEPRLCGNGGWMAFFTDNQFGIEVETQGEFPSGDGPLLLFRDDYVQPERLPNCDICARGVVDFAAENVEPKWHTLEDAGCELTLCHECWDDEPIGWRVVKVGDDGSVLLQSPTGARRRYVFSPGKSVSFVGRRGGDGESFRWEEVPESDAKPIRGEYYDGETYVYPSDIVFHLGINDDKRRRFTIIVEDVE